MSGKLTSEEKETTAESDPSRSQFTPMPVVTRTGRGIGGAFRLPLDHLAVEPGTTVTTILDG